MNDELMAALRDARDAAWKSLDGHRDSAYDTHDLINKAIRIAEASQRGAACAGSTCDNAVEYGGTGRPALYCGRRCRDRAAYRAKLQRKGQAARAL